MSDPGFNVAGEANWERYLRYCLSIDKLAAEMYQLGLEQAGIRVIIVADANSFSKAIEEPADAVVIEWEMLDVAGDEMLKQLALNARMAGRPVFVLINFISRVNDTTNSVTRVGRHGMAGEVRGGA